jgi:hypothetical protein
MFKNKKRIRWPRSRTRPQVGVLPTPKKNFALGLRPQAVLKTSRKVFLDTDLPPTIKICIPRYKSVLYQELLQHIIMLLNSFFYQKKKNITLWLPLRSVLHHLLWRWIKLNIKVNKLTQTFCHSISFISHLTFMTRSVVGNMLPVTKAFLRQASLRTIILILHLFNRCFVVKRPKKNFFPCYYPVSAN